MIASELIQELIWDSTFFNKKIGKVTVQNKEQVVALQKDTVTQAFELIYVFSDRPLSKDLLGAPLNTKVLYRRDLSMADLPRLSDDVTIYQQEGLIEGLFDLAYQAGHYSRFWLDANFSETAFKKLYQQWMKKSLQPTSTIFVVPNVKDLQGMVTLDSKENFTQIGLIGVDKKARGQRYGKKLVDACFHHTIKKGLPYLDVYTQAENVGACHFYEACQFQEVSKTYIYHFWTNEDTI
ncbi:MAG: GNAT family N-acetyltransferase [Bacteroidota bacterium]